MGRFGDGFEETGLGKAELEGAEFPREEFDDFECGWRWEEEGVDAVDYAVAAELLLLQLVRGNWIGWLDTYDVDGYDFAVEVDCQSLKAQANTETLGLATKSIFT